MGGTLLVTRSVNNQTFYKQKLEKEFGFSNVTVTSLEKDALNMLIRELKPDLVMMGARFYECSTPYMMGELKKEFPDIKNWAALSLEAYPPDLAMYFILNGIKSYDTAFDGFDKFFEGLNPLYNANDEKLEILLDFHNYPFICKYTIPIDHVLTHSDMQKLRKDYSEPETPKEVRRLMWNLRKGIKPKKLFPFYEADYQKLMDYANRRGNT